MADLKISAGVDIATLVSTDMVPVARSGSTSAYHATMAEVSTFVAAGVGGVTSWNTRTGAVVLTTADVTTALGYTPYNTTNPAGYAPIASPVFTGNPQAPTAAKGDSDTSIATTAFVQAAVSGSGTFVDAPSDGTSYGRLNAAWANVAPLASPTFTGTPTLPTGTIAITQTKGDSTTALATTAFVAAAVAGAGSGTVTNIATSGLVTGGPITGTGTISLASQAASTLVGNGTGSAAVPTAVTLGGGLSFVSGALTPAWNGGAVTSVGTGLSLSAGVLTATAVVRNAARMQIAWDTPAVVANDTVYFVYDAPYAGTINSMTYFTGNGSFTCNVQIVTTSVTGLAAVAVSSSTPATATATAANTFTAGQRIGVVITSATGSPTDALLSLNVTWS